jgi:DNA-binding IclR family transcriptional regulator
LGSTSRNGTGTEPGGVLAVNKAFAILDSFRQSDGDVLALGVLAERARLPKPTAHRIARSLVRASALEKVPGGYRLGMKLFELSERVAPRHDLRESALPFLQDLYAATGETVHLGVLDEVDVIYVDRIRGHQPVNVPSSVGGRLPAHCTALGKALLAHSPLALDAIRRRPLARRTAYSITVHATLLAELDVVRSTGIAFEREESKLGVHCVGAPVFVAGEVAAAISVAGPCSRIDVERLAAAVRTAANGLGRTLSTRQATPVSRGGTPPGAG